MRNDIGNRDTSLRDQQVLRHEQAVLGVFTIASGIYRVVRADDDSSDNPGESCGIN